MGDKILKKITTTLLLSSLLFAANNDLDLSWVDQQIEAIQKPRVGVSYREISLLKDPFIFLRPKEEKKKENKSQTRPAIVPKSVTNKAAQVITPRVRHNSTFELKAIVNDRALINEKWYRIGDTIGSYKVIKIDFTTVILKNAHKKVVLTTYTKKKP